MHIGEHLYSCDVCNKSFTPQSTLNEYQRIFSGDWPYSRGVCNKSFSRRCVLKRPKRIHLEGVDIPVSCVMKHSAREVS